VGERARWLLVGLVGWAGWVGAAAAESVPPERISLWSGAAPVDDGGGAAESADAFITVHRPEHPNGAAIVICPGGGYGGLVTEGEGHGIARWLNRHGIAGLVLEYRLPAGRPMVPLLDAQRAIRWARSHAGERGFNPTQIGILGFSAGGHLASTAATRFDDGSETSSDPVERAGCRPDFAILIYPVISMGEIGHAGSRANLLGPHAAAELITRFSSEAQVTDRTPPVFLAHATDDRVVPIEHSRRFHAAMKDHGGQAELLELPSGGHGLNGYQGPMWDAWQAGALAWLAEEKLIASLDATPSSPVKVFILAGQSNMEGQAVADLDGPDYNHGRGTLLEVLADPQRGGRFSYARKSGDRWPAREDVWVRYQREDAPLLKGALSVGFTAYGGTHHFGPELSFGHVVGNAITEPVLLIKTAWGGRSLYRDFRPPSSGGSVGPYFRKMIEDVRTALDRMETEFPALAGRGHELAGFVWYHGWNDGCEPQTAVPEYQTNLVNLIIDVRRELAAPALPVVIGELTGPWVEAPDEWADLRQAQAAAARHPEFGGTVRFVETHTFVRPPEESPNPTHGHHEFGNAETYLLVGEALGQAMLELTGHGVDGHQTRAIEGWTVHLNRQLLADQPDAVATALVILRSQLQQIVQSLPAPAVARLRSVPLWFSPEYSTHPGRAEYHPDAGWLRANGRRPAMAKAVEFTDTKNFAAEASRMPNFTLHELAHAYHDQILGFDHPKILAAYENGKSNGLYGRVARRHGSGKPETIERAYALVDAKEYFAELTEAYFSVNDYFPFTRADLESHDPQGAEVIRTLWGVPDR